MGNRELFQKVKDLKLPLGKYALFGSGPMDRALELFDLTMSDKRWKGRLREIGRARDVFCDAVLGGSEYGSSFQNIQKYFDYFGIAANTHN
jgi:hypothetical protein